MKYFNANAMIGAHFAPRQGKFFGVDDLIEEMDFFGIDEALVYHGMAMEYDLAIGNKDLIQCIAKIPRLHPCWVVGQFHSGHTLSSKELIKDAVDNNVEAVRLYFGGRFGDGAFIDMLLYRRLFTELEKHRFPTFIEFDENVEISSEQVGQLDKLLEDFPELPVILSARTIGFEIQRHIIYPRMDRYRNLHIEISGAMTNCLIENIVKKFGSEQLIFGTRYPWFGSGQARIALSYADISEKEHEAIAYDNLHTLIRRIKK